MKANWKHIFIAGSLGLGILGAQGATLTLSDGSTLQGELEVIHKGVYHFKTAFAGVLQIPQAQVTGLQSDEPVALRTQSGEVYQGPVQAGTAGTVSVSSSGGAVTTGLDTLVAGWKPGAKDPIHADREAELLGQLRKWKFIAGVDISGKDGNSENFGSALNMEAILEGPTDRLDMYGSYRYRETGDIRSEDEQKGGIRYTNYFSEKMGWFVREEIERDTIEAIDFRSTTAGGLSYRFIKEERLRVEGSAGLSYRYESYADPLMEDDGFAGLDFGLDLGWQFADWGMLVTKLSYIPSFEDFGDFLFVHDSGVDIPLGASDFWVMRFGLINQYNSNPGGMREKMDTTYFIRLMLTWQ